MSYLSSPNPKSTTGVFCMILAPRGEKILGGQNPRILSGKDSLSIFYFLRQLPNIYLSKL